MDLDALASQLFNRRRAETQEVMTDATTRTFIGTATADSHDGMVSVTLNGYETTAEDVGETQGYGTIEFPCGPNVKAGDSVVVSAVGGGTMKAPMVVSSSGSGDRQQEEIEEAATTATKYITDITDDGVMVHPDGDPTTGWRIADALEMLRHGVSLIRAWYDATKESALVRVGAEDGAHMVIGSSSIDLMESASSLIGRFTGHVSGAVRTLLMTLGDDQWGTGEVEVELEPDSFASANLRARANGVTTSAGYASVGATVRGDGQGTGYGHVGLVGDFIETSFGLSGFRRAGMSQFADLLGCQIRIAYGDITVPANSTASHTFTWVGGRRAGNDIPMGFSDASYIVSVTRTGQPSGFDKVTYTVTGRTADTVTVSGWNNYGAAVTQQLMLIGIDVRHSEWD